jgi:uncharacterized membrane protein
MKKITTLLTILASTIILFTIFACLAPASTVNNTGYADTAAAAEGDDEPKPKEESKNLKEYTFDLGSISLDPDDQEKSYFSSKNPPIIAFILKLINYALTIMGSIAVIVLIIGGFMMLVAQGNQQKLDEAKDIIKYAIMGLLVAFLSYIIVLFVQSLFV